MDKKFQMPEALLHQINECSCGGFMLFLFDKDGEPQVYQKFDNKMSAMALQYQLENWVKTLEALNLEEVLNGEPEDGDGDEELM